MNDKKSEHLLEVRVSKGGPDPTVGDPNLYAWTVKHRIGTNGESVWNTIAFSGNTCHAKPLFQTEGQAALAGHEHALALAAGMGDAYTAPGAIRVLDVKGKPLEIAAPVVHADAMVEVGVPYDPMDDGHPRRKYTGMYG